MTTMIHISTETYNLLRRRAREAQSTPEQVAETAIRLQLGQMVHIEQKPTAFGPQAYLRGSRVAARHVAAFLQAGHTAEEIIQIGLPHLPPAAVYEAIAYYYDHQAEIEAELAAESQEAVTAELSKRLTPEQLARLIGREQIAD
jgi:uncharacterized protein (DUF433 family)